MAKKSLLPCGTATIFSRAVVAHSPVKNRFQEIIHFPQSRLIPPEIMK
jgi:hypothetical protein